MASEGVELLRTCRGAVRVTFEEYLAHEKRRRARWLQAVLNRHGSVKAAAEAICCNRTALHHMALTLDLITPQQRRHFARTKRLMELRT